MHLDALRKEPEPIEIPFLVHRDHEANAAVIEIQGRKLLLKAGRWSRWTPLDFPMSSPSFVPRQGVRGIGRFDLQSVAPTFRLSVSPIHIEDDRGRLPPDGPGPAWCLCS